MRVVFAGTPPFAAQALDALVGAGHSVQLVLTQPDRPAGRGMRLTPSAVAQAAALHGLPVAKPASLKPPGSQEAIRNAAPDVMVVAAYGLILPPAVLGIPAHGCLNIHASLLPRWRGAAPIQRALLSGDATTGISIMQMEAGLDTGPVLLASGIPIGPRDTTGSLLARLSGLGADCIVEALARLGSLAPQPQDDARATYAAKIDKSEARIDWASSAVQIDRQVRAFNPAPGAEARIGAETLKIWSAQPVEGTGEPGEVIDARPQSLRVACGEGALELLEIQRPGSRRMPVAEFLHGNVWPIGAVFS